MSYNLFLDDKRIPTDCRNYSGDESIYETEKWEIITNFEDFVDIIEENGIPNLVSFDYQLSDDTKDGLDCAKYLKEACGKKNVPIPKYRVHSAWSGIDRQFRLILG